MAVARAALKTRQQQSTARSSAAVSVATSHAEVGPGEPSGAELPARSTAGPPTIELPQTLDPPHPDPVAAAAVPVLAGPAARSQAWLKHQLPGHELQV